MHGTMLFKRRRWYTEATLMKLIEIKIIVTSINHLMNSFRKTNVHAHILN
jgi:hypothetical protein